MEEELGILPVSKKKSLREEVYESLRRAILHGKVRPGQRLIEEKLAHEAAISRTPVREAFYKLEKDDLVTRRAKGGFVVKQFTRADVDEILGIRIALESYAAYLATSHITADKMAAMEKKLDESRKAMKAKDFNRVIQLHTEFHDLLYKMSKSKKLFQMISHFNDYFYRYRVALIRTAGNIEYALEDHRDMLNAMKKKDPKGVEKMVREHLERTRQSVLKAIDAGKMTP
jgi:DNA-binding GntR family transcriptional regulator